jgi:diacylglycerol kinase (ATP)
MGIPKTLRPAVEVLCTSSNVRKIDVAQVGDLFFIQRLYVGIEPEEQTSREMKDKYGVFAYAINMAQRRKTQKEVNYQVTFDGELLEFQAVKVYVVNSGMTGSGHSIMETYAIDDGVLDAFVLDRANLETIRAATSRFLHLDTKKAHKYYRQGREITIDTDPDQPVWFDGEYLGRTPVTVTILPGALPIVVP